ncbi:hypothetical protein [[Clostridium] fimetarium]|uniref:Uncharacterized protein n=1 Tax=[Clostridium] fimetarium TaxID=99656 RepID=A0A1I0RLP3_9FIRM|nr:hypothetical protein [[Clostridium] fimetarium]SEW41948.1 hypothetical protein SAMN05421659_11845 [[Clostridium] fimetarium]
MNILELLIGQDIGTYNIDMIIIYIVVLIVAFIVCVILSNNLNVYSPRMNKDINKVTTAEHILQAEVLDEVAATSVDSVGAEDEQ